MLSVFQRLHNGLFSLNTLTTVSSSTPQPVSWMTCNRIEIGNQFPGVVLLSLVSTRWELCLLPCAGNYLMLLNLQSGDCRATFPLFSWED